MNPFFASVATFVAAIASGLALAAPSATIHFDGGIPEYEIARGEGGVLVIFSDAAFRIEGPHKVLKAPEGKIRLHIPLDAPSWRTTRDPAGSLTIEAAGSQVPSPKVMTVAANGGGLAPDLAAPLAPGDSGGGGSGKNPPRKVNQGVLDMLAQQGVATEVVSGKSLPQVKEVLQNYSTNLSIPDSPGLVIVGLGTEEVARPTSPRALATALQPAVDKDGNVKRGLAIEFAPFKIFAPATPKQKYDSDPLVRALWNTQVSIGTAKPADSNDKSLKAGIGLQSIIYRHKDSDPLRDEKHRDCLQGVIKESLRDYDQDELGGEFGTDPKADKALTAAGCYKKLAARTWNATALAVALATSRFSETGNWSDGKQDARGGWVSFSYGFENLRSAFSFLSDVNATLMVRRLLHETAADPLDDKAFVKQDSWLAGGKLLWRSENFNYFVEYAYKRLEIAGREKDKLRRSVLGLEWQVSPGMWVVVAVGGEGGRSNGKDNSFLTTGFKIGSSTESILPAK